MRFLPSILIITVLLAAASSGNAWAQAGPDNRYCAPGNRAQFSAKDGPASLPQWSSRRCKRRPRTCNENR